MYLVVNGRGGEIRTPDPLLPGQVPYRWATPRCCMSPIRKEPWAVQRQGSLDDFQSCSLVADNPFNGAVIHNTALDMGIRMEADDTHRRRFFHAIRLPE